MNNLNPYITIHSLPFQMQEKKKIILSNKGQKTQAPYSTFGLAKDLSQIKPLNFVFKILDDFYTYNSVSIETKSVTIWLIGEMH